MNTHFRPELFAAALALLPATTPAQSPLKTEHFDRDPGWEGHNNRIELAKVPIVKQDFGYSTTSFASAAPGEIGGSVQRSTRPAMYAAEIAPKTLDDRFSAAGTFAIKASGGSGGVFFGFVNAQQPGGSGRPIGSLGLDFDFENKGGRLAVRLITGGNQSCGTFITPYLPGKYRTTPLKNDGTRYSWTLDYDPAGANGQGRFTFHLRSDNHPLPVIDPALPAASQKEERARFPTTTKFEVDLPAGYKQQGTTIDRFGLMNMMKAGGVTQIYFADLRLDGKPIDLSKEPAWIGAGNRDSYEDREQTGAHSFGFSAQTPKPSGPASPAVRCCERRDRPAAHSLPPRPSSLLPRKAEAPRGSSPCRKSAAPSKSRESAARQSPAPPSRRAAGSRDKSSPGPSRDAGLCPACRCAQIGSAQTLASPPAFSSTDRYRGNSSSSARPRKSSRTPPPARVAPRMPSPPGRVRDGGIPRERHARRRPISSVSEILRLRSG